MPTDLYMECAKVFEDLDVRRDVGAWGRKERRGTVHSASRDGLAIMDLYECPANPGANYFTVFVDRGSAFGRFDVYAEPTMHGYIVASPGISEAEIRAFLARYRR